MRQSTVIWKSLARRDAWGLGLTLTGSAVFLLVFYPFAIAHSESFNWFWVPIQILALCESAVVASMFLLALPKSVWAKTWTGIAANLGISVVVGVQENFFAWYFAEHWGIANSAATPVEKVFGGALLGLGILLVWVSISASLRSHRATIIQLLTKTNRLLSLKAGLESEVEAAQKLLIEQTLVTVVPKLKQVEGLLKDSKGARPAIEELRNLINFQIRPLSKSFNLAAELKISDAPAESLDDLKGLRFPSRFNVRQSIRPWVAWLIALPLQINAFVYFFPAQLLPTLILSFAVNILLLFVAKRVTRNQDFPMFGGILIVLLVALLSASPEWLVICRIAQGPSQFIGGSMACLFASLCVIWNTLVNATLQSQLESEALLEQMNLRIQGELSYFNQSLWLQKRRWGYLLHGSVQAALTVAIARLTQLASRPVKDENPEVVPETLDLVVSELGRIGQVISEPQNNHVDLARELQLLCETWKGVLDIDLNVSNEVLSLFDKDENLAMAANEICREAATNAYRHGGADEMQISIAVIGGRHLALEITNNGSSPKPSETGMGHEMMEALTFGWSLVRDDEIQRTVLKAALALPL